MLGQFDLSRYDRQVLPESEMLYIKSLEVKFS